MGLSDSFPLFPPADWFDAPSDLRPGQRASLVTEGPESGRFVAIVAPYNQCILAGGKRGECWTAPKSPTNYAAAMQGHTRTAEGAEIDTANIGGGVNHAPPTAGLNQAVDHYANTATQLLRVRYHDVPGVGIVAAGAAWPGISDLDIAKIRASALSGDWRWREELRAYDMAGSQLVSTPGFPRMPKVAAYAASLSDPHPAILGGWGGPPEEAHVAPEPTVTLTLTATETARLHELLTGPPAGVTNVFASAAEPGTCACGGHTAAPGDQALSPAVAPDAGAPVTRAEFDALVQQVEEVRGQVMSDALEGVDAMVASMPLPPELVDESRWQMPVTAAAFDEAKHPRNEKGGPTGGRFRALVRAMAEEPGRVDLNDPRIDEAAAEGGASKGKVVEQVNMTKRRIENGTDAEFEQTYAKSMSDRENDDTLEALAGRGPSTDAELTTYYPQPGGGYGTEKHPPAPGEKIPPPPPEFIAEEERKKRLQAAR